MEVKRTIRLDDYEHRVMVHALNSFRSSLLKESRDTGPVDNILTKIIQAKGKGIRGRAGQER